MQHTGEAHRAVVFYIERERGPDADGCGGGEDDDVVVVGILRGDGEGGAASGDPAMEGEPGFACVFRVALNPGPNEFQIRPGPAAVHAGVVLGAGCQFGSHGFEFATEIGVFFAKYGSEDFVDMVEIELVPAFVGYDLGYG